MLVGVITVAVVNTVILCWMLALTRRTWRTLPSGALVPVHGGANGWDRWRPKESALVLWPVISGLIWLLNLGIMIYAAVDPGARSQGALTALPVALMVPMVILAVTEHYAVKAAIGAANDPNTLA